MEIEEALLEEVERVTKTLGTTRSEFICNALRLVLRRQTIAALENQHQAGYAKHPVAKDEFDGWETEQVWGDE